KAKFDVAIERGFGQVRRRNEHRLVIDDHCLRVKDPGGTVRFERARVEEHSRTSGAWPLFLPEPLGEPPHQLVGRGRVALLALDVQEQGDMKLWSSIHST